MEELKTENTVIEIKEEQIGQNCQRGWVTLKIIHLYHQDIFFKVKESAHLGPLMAKCKEKFGNPTNLKIRTNQRVIKMDDTPQTLGLKYNDINVIKAYYDNPEKETTGANVANLATEKQLGYIMLKVIGPDTNEIHFRVKQNTRMGKLKRTYSKRAGVQVTSLRFLFDGRRILDDETPDALDMQENDVIEVYQEQFGGTTAEGNSASVLFFLHSRTVTIKNKRWNRSVFRTLIPSYQWRSTTRDIQPGDVFLICQESINSC